MYRITNINTGANLGAVDTVVYIKIEIGRASCRERVCQYV